MTKDWVRAGVLVVALSRVTRCCIEIACSAFASVGVQFNRLQLLMFRRREGGGGQGSLSPFLGPRSCRDFEADEIASSCMLMHLASWLVRGVGGGAGVW